MFWIPLGRMATTQDRLVLWFRREFSRYMLRSITKYEMHLPYLLQVNGNEGLVPSNFLEEIAIETRPQDRKVNSNVVG